MDFLERLGIARIPRVVDVGSTEWCGKQVSDNDKQIDGLDELLHGVDQSAPLFSGKRFVNQERLQGSEF